MHNVKAYCFQETSGKFWVAAESSTIVISFSPVVQALCFEPTAVGIHIPIFSDTATVKCMLHSLYMIYLYLIVM